MTTGGAVGGPLGRDRPGDELHAPGRGAEPRDEEARGSTLDHRRLRAFEISGEEKGPAALGGASAAMRAPKTPLPPAPGRVARHATRNWCPSLAMVGLESERRSSAANTTSASSTVRLANDTRAPATWPTAPTVRVQTTSAVVPTQATRGPT